MKRREYRHPTSAWAHTAWATAVCASAAMVLAGCGEDDAVTDAVGCNTVSDCSPGQLCVNSRCTTGSADVVVTTDTPPVDDAGDEPDVPTDIAEPDVGLQDVVQPVDVESPKDTPAPFDPGTAPDLVPDNVPPTLKSSSPAKGETGVALPWELELTFSEPVKNIEKETLEIHDVADALVKGTYASDAAKAVWTFTPTGPLMVASPYTVDVNSPNQFIADLANVKFVGITQFQFFTAAPENRDGYADLARTHAPRLRLLLNGSKPQYDVPTALNADGDFDLKNNKAWLDKASTKELTPTIYWDVMESESHFYIQYVWYFTGRAGTDGGDFENDASGALVVVEKWGEKRPIELITWFKTNGEYLNSFVTAESGIAPANLNDAYITEVHSQADLFPNGRPEIAITSGIHESCAWNSSGSSFACDLPAGDRPALLPTTLVLDASDTATAYKKKGTSSWPTNNELVTGTKDGEAHYVLADMLEIWWPRRSQKATMFYDSSNKLDYTDKGKPKFANFPKYFIAADGSQSKGRAPWSAGWEPVGAAYQSNMPAGQFFIDPARHIKERHDTTYLTTAFDATAKTGFSAIWCLNAYFNVDARGTTDACPEL